MEIGTMTDEQIIEKMSDIFSKTFSINKFTLSVTMDEVPEWDSLKHIQLLSSIEKAFRIELQFEDTIEMITGKSILTIIKKYISYV